MKIPFRGLFVAVLVEIVLPLKADLQQELVSLQRHLVILENALQKGGGTPSSARPDLVVGALSGGIVVPKNLSPQFLQDEVNAVAQSYSAVQERMRAFNINLTIFLNLAKKISDGQKKNERDAEIQEFINLVESRLRLDLSIEELENILKNIGSPQENYDENSINEVRSFLQKIRHDFKVFSAAAKTLINNNYYNLNSFLFTYNTVLNSADAFVTNKIYNKGALRELKPKGHKLKKGGSVYEGGSKTFADRFKKIKNNWNPGATKIAARGGDQVTPLGQTTGGQVGTQFTLKMPNISSLNFPKFSSSFVDEEYFTEINKNFSEAKQVIEKISTNLMPAFIKELAKKKAANDTLNSVSKSFQNLRSEFYALANFEGEIGNNTLFMSNSGAEDAKLASDYLTKILGVFQEFLGYIQKVDEFIEVNYPEVKIGVERAYSPMADMAKAPKQFEDHIMKSNALNEIRDINDDLRMSARLRNIIF